MAKTRSQADAEREQRAVTREVRTHHQEIDRALRGANSRSKRAVAAVLAEQRDADHGGHKLAALANAWARPPSKNALWALRNIARAGRWAGRGSRHDPRGSATRSPATSDPAHAPFHFKLNQTHSGGAAAGAPENTSNGLKRAYRVSGIAETQAERVRLWSEIAKRAHTRCGFITLNFDGEPEFAREIPEAVPQWVDSGLCAADLLLRRATWRAVRSRVLLTICLARRLLCNGALRQERSRFTTSEGAQNGAINPRSPSGNCARGAEPVNDFETPAIAIY